jgi:RNA polymerase sigma-70 factor (ECF subfamily)
MQKQPSPDINELLLQVGNDNQLAFKAVFDFYKEPFYLASYKIIKSHHLTEEIVQEIFIGLWVNRKKVAAADNPQAYLITMLHNSIYGHFRKLALEKTMKKNVVYRFPKSDSGSIEEGLCDKENNLMLETIISQLPPQQRIIYKLCRQQGLSREQIAAELHISPHTVKNHLHKAMQFIRSYYKLDTPALICIGIIMNF